jgi:phosphate/sulfate permease
VIETTGYSRQLRTFDATMLTVGGIIGGGIFLNPAVVAQRVHTAPLIIGTWVLGGVIAVMGALCFAELGGRRPWSVSVANSRLRINCLTAQNCRSSVPMRGNGTRPILSIFQIGRASCRERVLSCV